MYVRVVWWERVRVSVALRRRHLHVYSQRPKQNFAAPRQHYFKVALGGKECLWEDAWFRRRCGGNEVKVVDIWQIEAGNWVRKLASEITITVENPWCTILLRPTEDSPYCAGLGEEIALLEQSNSLVGEGLSGRTDLRV